jgi:hypothetical protein
MTMPFGKYQGKPIAELPRDYIRWCLTQPNLKAGLRRALRKALDEAGPGSDQEQDHGSNPANNQPSRFGLDAQDSALLLELVQAGRRAMAKTQHPDQGGDTDRMQRINHIVDVVQGRVRK